MADHPEDTSLRLAEAATPGPYTTQVFDSCGSNVVDVRAGNHVVSFGASAANASHIAHAHPGRVAAWLGCVARLRERVAEGHALECETRMPTMTALVRGEAADNDRSRRGYLVHDAVSQGRWVEITAYLEGGHPRVARFVCRTAEQAFSIATLLRDAMTTDGEDDA